MEQWNSYLDLTITDFLNELYPRRKATYLMVTGVWLFQKIGVKKPTNLLWVLDSAPFMTVIFEIDVFTGVKILSSTKNFIPIFANDCQTEFTNIEIIFLAKSSFWAGNDFLAWIGRLLLVLKILTGSKKGAEFWIKTCTS